MILNISCAGRRVFIIFRNMDFGKPHRARRTQRKITTLCTLPKGFGTILPDRPAQPHSAISPRDTAECFETSSALALPSLFGTAKAVVKSFIG